MKLEYIEVYENISDKFSIEYCWSRVKVTVDLQMFFPFTTIQTVWSYNSTLAQARKLMGTFTLKVDYFCQPSVCFLITGVFGLYKTELVLILSVIMNFLETFEHLKSNILLENTLFQKNQ